MSKLYSDMIAEELHSAGWSHGYITGVDAQGNHSHAASAYKGDHQCTATAETLLTAYIALQALTAQVDDDDKPINPGKI